MVTSPSLKFSATLLVALLAFALALFTQPADAAPAQPAVHAAGSR